MVQAFVVMLTIGRYEDATTTAHKVFVSADDAFAGAWRARHCVEEGNRRIGEVNGMLRAVDAMMEVWEKAHPHPLDGEREVWRETTPEEDAAYEVWREARESERRRLFDLTGIPAAMKEANVPEHEQDIYTSRVEMRYFIADDVEVISF